MIRTALSMVVNGSPVEDLVDPRMSLVEYLREGCGLTGTHVSCETGVCGACTVLLDGLAVRSCVVLAVQAEGSEVETVEQVDNSRPMREITSAMTTCNAFQCGFCAPGIVMASRAVVRDLQFPDSFEDVLDSHLCRCSGYVNLRKVFEDVSVEPEGERG